VGAAFAIPFLVILTCHEMGHYVAARLRGIEVSLPYFLPFPPYFSVVGTLGAFIRLKGVMVRRAALLDVGASGPSASFLLSGAALAWGLPHSTMVPGFADGLTPFAINFLGERIWLGSGVLSWVMAEWMLPSSPGGELILLHPVAFAGWLGLFVTALNLLPLGQLDGGHILYALLEDRQKLAGRVFLFLLFPMGFLWWGWWFWGCLALVLGRGRLGHSRVLQPWVPLDPVRTRVAYGAILVFFVTLPPLPIRL
jgi:membrane-associated protease RseP (regulator of RpoE activity)